MQAMHPQADVLYCANQDSDCIVAFKVRRRFNRFRLLFLQPLLSCICSASRRLLSRHYLRWLAQQHAQSPLLRLGLHPSDAAYPDVIRHWQDLLAACLETRTPVTKNGFAQVCAQALMGGTEVALDGRAQASY